MRVNFRKIDHPWSTAVVALALVAMVGAVSEAQAEEPRLPDATDSQFQTDRPDVMGEESPQFRASQFQEQRAFESLQRQDEAIVRLRQLIDRTPRSDDRRAEYLYNLSEIFWERARYYNHSAVEQNDRCFEYDDVGDEDGARRCRFRMRDMEEEAERLREESVDLYVEIINNYPDFEHLDTIYFHLGTNLMEVGQRQEGLDIFRRLVAEFPQTPYVPQVLVHFGDYYFEEGDLYEALAAYQRAVEYPDSPVFTYASYKMGWVYFNLENYERALEEFLTVVERARSAPEGSADRSMLRQSRNDVVRAYARIGSPERALPFFQDIAPDRSDWLSMGETLAMYYGNQAEFATSNRMYRELINVNRDSIAVIEYQYEIVRNQTTINSYDEAAIQEIIRMMRLITMAEEGHFVDAEGEEWERTYAKVAEASRNWAATYHREAQRTLNERLFVMAHHLYEGFLTTFPEAEQAYEMSFFHGELLYGLEAWDEAAAAYERAMNIDPDGEYKEDIVLGTMHALFNVVDTSEERVAIEADFEWLEDPDAEVPEPEELPEMQQRLMRAAQDYVELVPDGERIVEVLYVMGRTYFEYNHLEEAARYFEQIVFDHPDHDLAVVSANVHLGTLLMMQDFHGLNEAVTRYREEVPIQDREFQDDLLVLHEGIRYNLCVLHDEEEEWEQGAHCYVAYVQEFPNSEQLDRALYNAALNFERIHDLSRAIQVRQHLLDLRPDSELVPETLFNIGGNYHAWAIYEEASNRYEEFVRRFPEHEDAEDALSNAATFRQGLGQYEEAINNYQLYIETFGRDNPDRAAASAYEIARIYEDQGREQEALDQYQLYINRFADDGTPGWLLEAHLKQGLSQWERGQRDQALSTFEHVLSLFEGLDEETQAASQDGRDAAAQAKFMIAEDAFEKADNLVVDAEDNEELQDQMREKMEALLEAQAEYEEVITFLRPGWAIAAMYRIGDQTNQLAETVRETPVPSHLNEQQREFYLAGLEDWASQFEQSAVDLFIMALDAARENNWFNEYSELAEGELARLRPRDFRRPSEMRAQPQFFLDGFMKAPFITEFEVDDVLRDLGGDEPVGGQAADDRDEEEPAS